MLDMLVETAGDGGNLLMNVGPDDEGRIPQQFIERSDAIGQWLKIHGEAIYGCEAGDVCDFVTYGRQTKKGNNLYLIIRFWDPSGEVHLTGLATRVTQAILLTTGQEVGFEQSEDHVIITGLPLESLSELFPVIKLVCESSPQARPWAVDRLWQGDARRFTSWAADRGKSVNACR
jgi:alpha-L-fucosidase